MKKTLPVAAPKATVCTKKAEPEAYSSKQLPVEDIDQDRDNPQLVSYYAKDIYQYLRQLEVYCVLSCFLTLWLISILFLVEIFPNWWTLHGWLHDPANYAHHFSWLACWCSRTFQDASRNVVSKHFCDGLFSAGIFNIATLKFPDVNFINFQMDKSINRRELQLVGLTAMLIAAKFEETWAPEINDFVYMSDKAYTAKDVLAMECRMLQKLDFRMGRPLPLHFLRRNTQAASQILDQVSQAYSTCFSSSLLILLSSRWMSCIILFRSTWWNLLCRNTVFAIICLRSSPPLLFVYLFGNV